MNSVSIEVIGDAFADVYCYLEAGLPSLGGDSRLTEPIHTVPGGSALNTTTHLASLIKYFGNEGRISNINLQSVINENDVYGKLIIDHAKTHNFRLINRRISNVPSCFVTSEAKKFAGEKSTGHCAVIVASNDRSFMTHLGCMEDFKGSHILPISSSPECTHQHVHIAGYYNIRGFWGCELANQLKLMRDSMKKTGTKLTISLVPQQDASNVWDGGLSEVLKYVDFLILNEDEAKSIARCQRDIDEATSNKKIANHFHESSPNTFVIVTRGSRGAVVFHSGDITLDQSSPRQITNPLDPTGAGDAFASGFIYGLLDSCGAVATNDTITIPSVLKQALRWGCALGTCNVLVKGASTTVSKHSIETMLQELG